MKSKLLPGLIAFALCAAAQAGGHHKGHHGHHAIQAKLTRIAVGQHRSESNVARNQFRHPVETLIGQGLFQLSIPVVALISGAPLNAFAMVVATQIFIQAGTLNHVWVDLPRFPFRWLQFLTTGHAAHHVDMNQGNYCQVTLLFDWLFGTYEKPVVRATP